MQMWTFLGWFMCVSWTFLGWFRCVSWTFLGWFRCVSWTWPGHVLVTPPSSLACACHTTSMAMWFCHSFSPWPCACHSPFLLGLCLSHHLHGHVVLSLLFSLTTCLSLPPPSRSCACYSSLLPDHVVVTLPSPPPWIYVFFHLGPRPMEMSTGFSAFGLPTCSLKLANYILQFNSFNSPPFSYWFRGIFHPRDQFLLTWPKLSNCCYATMLV